MKDSAVIGLVLFIGISVVRVAAGTEPKSDVTPIPVSSKSLEQLVIYPESRVSASVVSLNHADISVEAQGVVKQISVEVGSQVKSGDELIRLDCQDATFQQKLARSAQSLASKEWQRADKLKQSQTIAEQAYNQARATYEQASISMQQAALAVERCVLHAPYDGVVTKRYAQLGAMLSPGSPVVRLLEQGRVEGVANVPEKQAEALTSTPGLAFVSGEVRYPVRFRVRQAFIDPGSRQQEIRFEFIDSTPMALPLAGSSGWLLWVNKQPHFPANLIIERDGKHGFFTLVDGKALFIALAEVHLGHPAVVNLVELPIEMTTQVIVEGRHRLVDGDLVSTIKK